MGHLRITQKPRPLEKFIEGINLQGHCTFCTDEEDDPGIVVAQLSPNNMQVLLISCLLCGQQYTINREDENRFYGPYQALVCGIEAHRTKEKNNGA